MLNRNNKTLLLGITLAVIMASVFASTTVYQAAAKTTFTNVLDFHIKAPHDIYAKSGETLTIPVDIYGSAKARGVDFVVTKADLKRGAIDEDTKHPTLTAGFNINLPVTHIDMQAMNGPALGKPIKSVNMTISIDNSVKPGLYLFGIHMIDDSSPPGIVSQSIKYFYIHVQ